MCLSVHLFHRTGVHHPLSSPEVPGRDRGLLHLVLCEGHHRAVDHASEWDEVSEAVPQGNSFKTKRINARKDSQSLN